MSDNIATYTAQPLPEAIETLLMGGDLTPLTPEQRLSYYKAVCQSLGLNPLTKPFAFLKFNNAIQLYATKDCTEQLRRVYGISLKILCRETIDGVYVVTAGATLSSGRSDESTGAVAITNLKGDALANAFMKAETKSKRRVTLSICGLGMIDESEVDSISGAERVAVDFKTGEIRQRQITDSSNAVSNGRGSIEDTLDGPSRKSLVGVPMDSASIDTRTKKIEGQQITTPAPSDLPVDNQRGTQNVAEWLSETAVTELENFAIGKGWGVVGWNRMLVEFQIPSEDRIPARWLGRIKTFLVKPENLAKIQEEERVARSVAEEGVL